MDLPPKTVEVKIPPAVMTYCANESSKRFNISPYIIKAIARVEGGKIGTMSRNSNGTYDLGIMQLNTTNFKRIKRAFPTVTKADLVLKPCINIYIATWWLSREIKSAKGDVWKGIGNYHSRTPKYHNRYLKRFKEHYAIVVNEAVESMRRFYSKKRR